MSGARGAETLIALYKYNFWVRTRQDPPRAVRWEAPQHADGRQSFRGKHWVEVLPHGVDRTPRRFYTADVEHAGPHEWLTYYPAANEPVCGWGRPRLPHGDMQYCPALRRGEDPFCPKHMAELTEERNPSDSPEPCTGSEPVPASE